MWDAGWSSGWGWGLGMGWMMLFGGLLPLLVLGLIVYLVAQAADRGRSAGYLPGPPVAPRETPLEVAERRYAAGEISREEFTRIRDDLGGRGAPPAG